MLTGFRNSTKIRSVERPCSPPRFSALTLITVTTVIITLFQHICVINCVDVSHPGNAHQRPSTIRSYYTVGQQFKRSGSVWPGSNVQGSGYLESKAVS